MDKRTRRVSVFFTPDEYADLLSRAGIDPADLPRENQRRNSTSGKLGRFVREAALSSTAPVIDPIAQKQWADLAKPLANLNQIAHHLNHHWLAGTEPDLAKIHRYIVALRRKLLPGDEA